MGTYLLYHLLEESARRSPDAPAVAAADRLLSYRDLDRQSSRLAAALAREGMRKGDRVGLFLEKSAQGIIALYAILKGGGIYVPIDPEAPPERANLIVERCGIRLLFASAQTLRPAGDRLKTAGVRVVDVGGDAFRTMLQSDSAPCAPPGISDLHPAYILHTSGSTGEPKGVVISHRNALAFVEMAAEYFGIRSDDRLACHAPLHFDLSVFDLYVAARQGACVVLLPEKLGIFPANLARFISEERISVWNSVASLLALLVDRGRLEKYDYPSLRLILFSGEPMGLPFLRELMKRFPKAELYNIYGQTEANSSTCYRVGTVPQEGEWRLPIGKAFPNFDVFALTEDGSLLEKEGERGELYVSSSTVAQGYWKDEPRTSERFVRDPREPMSHAFAYRTGDLVTRDAEGNFIFLGRADHQVKSRGYRVNLSEIDHVLSRHPHVREALTVAVPDDVFTNRILSFLRLAAEEVGGTEEILEHCGRLLPPYMLPEAFFFVREFPKTTTGKIDRQALIARAAGSRP